jgi:hypothetical protein
MTVLASVWFGGSEFGRMARVLETSARSWCPSWDVRVRQVTRPEFSGPRSSQAQIDNGWKLTLWTQIVNAEPDGSQVLIVDADTFVVGNLDELWETEFDFAYTGREQSRFPLNAGVIAVRVNDASRAFMSAWSARDKSFFNNDAARMPWRERYGGYNQASLGSLLEGGYPAGVRVGRVPCSKWNCEDSSWAGFGSTTRIVHVKGALRTSIFGTGWKRDLAPLVRLWRDWERVV